MRMKRLFPPILRILLVSWILTQPIHAQKIDKTSPQAAPLKSTLEYTVSTNNLLSAWLRNDGLMDQGPLPENRLSLPPGWIVYSSGIIWSGVWENPSFGNPVIAGGQSSTAGTGVGLPATIEGWIESPGTSSTPAIAVSPSNPRVKIYRIRRDWQQFFDSNNEPITGLTEIRNEAAKFFNVSQPSPEQERQVLLRYREDWENWPGDLGAPYYDLNGNDSWDPGIDEPGLNDAEQVIWFVCNDLSPTLSSQIFGSIPVGLELQFTQWSRRNSYQPPDASTLFRRYRLINKSGFDITNMYFSQYLDVDIVEIFKDLAGSETSRQLAYVYGGVPIDRAFTSNGYGTPSFGATLLQGPLVEAPGETARFDFRERQGYRNQPMSSFAWRGSNSIPGEDILTENILQDQTPLRWYNWLRGYLPEADTSLQIQRLHRSGPEAGSPTFFPLDGNPLLGTGDIDATGTNSGIGDRAIFSNTGPFTLTNSDTQEVIYALIAGYSFQQEDNLSGLGALFNFTDQLRQNWNPAQIRPVLSSETTAGPLTTILSVSADLTAYNGPTNIQINCSPRIGGEASFSFSLEDNGLQGDSLAGDGIFSGQIEVTNRKYPFEAELSLTSGGQIRSFPAVLENLCLRPDPRVTNLRVLYENGLQDLYINNQEQVRLGFDLINSDGINDISGIEFAELRLGQFNTLASSLAAGDTLQNNTLFLDMLGNNSNSVAYSYRIRFDGHIAYGQGAYPGVRWEPPGIWRQILDVDVVQGVDGTIEPTIADINFLTGHQYEISFYGNAPDTSLRWQLLDITANEIKTTDQRVLDKENNVFPVIDGIEWKVFTPEPGILKLGGGKVGIVETAYAGTPLDSTQWDDGAPFEGNSVWQALNSTSSYYVSSGTNTSLIEFVEANIEFAVPDEYEIRFTSNDALAVYGYDGDIITSVPFELWNIGSGTPNDPSDDVRMIPVLRSNNAVPTATWNWGSGTDPKFGLPSSDLIYFFDPVDQSPGETSYGSFTAQCQADGGPGNTYSTRSSDNFFADGHGDFRAVLRSITICDFAGSSSPPPAGTVIRFYTTKVSAPGDTARVLAPSIAVEPPPPVIPETFALSQNFPNPFNPSTKIRLDLPEDAPVKLEIFNTLGQRVKKLVNGDLSAGEYEFRWDGSGDSGEAVASGIYFYRVQAGTFKKTRRMLLLR